MHVGRIRLRRFMSHEKTELVLPKSGIVLVTGPNGAGKSALMEAVSMAMFGKTLRGSSPFRSGERGMADVIAHTPRAAVNATMEWTGSKKVVRWKRDGDLQEYDTNTKALAALASLVGSHDVWRRTHVFSSSDASSFTTATDKARKQLLETLLGIDWFDSALLKARHEFNALRPHYAQLAQRAESAVGEIARWQDEVNKAEEAAEGLEKPKLPVEVGERVIKLEKMFAQVDRDTKQIAARQVSIQQKVNSVQNEALRLARKAKEMPDTCFACEQPIPPDRRRQVEKEAKRAEKQAVEEMKEASAFLDELKEELGELQAESATLSKKILAARVDLETYEEKKRRWDMVESAKERAGQNLTKLRQKAEAVAEELEKVAVDIAELGACVHILGYKGVRAQVLDHALSGIEAIANVWLQRLVGDRIELELSSYSEKKGGGTNDSISLTIHGAGGGHGYTGASGGERRRVDVALLLALAEAASDSADTRGTMFFDEVFDALDDEGIEAVTAALQDLAKTRAVVVVSHSHGTALEAVADAHVRIESGCLIC